MPWTRAVAAIKASRMGLGSGTCSLAQRCATLELMDRDGCKKGLTHGYPFTPGGHLPVTLAGFDLAELRHDIRIQDKHPSNSVGLGIQSAFGGSNSTSASASVLESKIRSCRRVRAPGAAVNRNVQGCAISLSRPARAAVHVDGWAWRYRLHQIAFVPPPWRVDAS